MSSLRPSVLGVFTVVCLGCTIALAQATDCLDVVYAAIESARELCGKVPLNQVCYGNPPVEIQPRANVRLVFAEPGDQVDVSAIESLTTLPADEQTNTWGLALFNLRGNFPNSGFRMVAFGDVSIQNESDSASDFAVLSVTVSHPQGANVRAAPAQDAALVRRLNTGDTVLAVGRLADNSWIRLLDGWVSADLLRTADDLNVLRVLLADEAISGEIYGPMQAFSFHIGSDVSSCAEAPRSGLLAQTTGENAFLKVNGVDIGFTDTIWLQTDEEGATLLTVLSGTAYYTEVLWNAGETVRFGAEGDRLFFDAPTDYDYVLARNLPLALLPRPIELPFSTGGLITPFEPGTGFLNTIPADAACTVAWTADVNMRAGPGTNYPIRQGIAGGYYAQPDARAVGTDGRLWWRLADSIWLASDNTAAAGACGSLPLVDAPPTDTPG